MTALPSSLRARLMLLIAAAFLPLLALSVFSAIQQWRTAIENSRSEAVRLAALAGENQQRVIEGTRQVLEILARTPEIRLPDSRECYEFLRSVLSDRNWFASLGVIGRDGYLRCHDGRAQRIYLGDRGYFRDALSQNTYAAGEFQIGRVSGIMSLNIGRPLLGPNGNATGVLYAALDLKVLGRIAGEIALPAGTTLTIFDRKGVVLARKPSVASLLGRPFPERRVVEAALSGRPGRFETGTASDRRLIAYAPVGGLAQPSMYVAIEKTEESMLQALSDMLVFFFMGLAIATVTAMAVAWASSSALVVNPIRRVIATARKVSDGNLSARTGLADSAGELGELARAFESMTCSLEDRVSALLAAESRLSETSATYRKLFLDNPVPMWLYARESMKFLEVNGAAIEHYGYTRDEFLRMTVLNIRPPEDVPEITKYLASLPEGRQVSGVWRHVCKDGTLIRVEVTSHDTEWQGCPARLVLAYDVTKRETSAAALAQLQARYRTLVELSPEPIHVHRDGRFTFMNSAAVKFFRAESLEQMIGRSLYDFLLPEFQAIVKARVGRMERGEVLPRSEQRMRVLDGSVIDVEVSAAPISDEGKPAVMVMLRDITERKRAERALASSEERFRALTELNADWYWEQDEFFRFVDLAQGRDRNGVLQQYVGKTRWELPFNRASDEEWARHKETLEAHETFYDFEMARIDDDGHVLRYISISGYPIFDDQGRFTGYRGIGKDVSERKRALKALEESENRYRTLVDLSPAPIYLHRDGIFRFLNRAALDFYHASSPDQLIGKDSRDFVAEPYRARSIERVRRMMAGEHLPRIELQIIILDGEVRDAELAASIIDEAGERSVMVVLRDITDRKRAERELKLLNEELEIRVGDRTAQLEASNRELEAFAYSVSHDLRAPLRTIDGFSAAVLEDYARTMDPQAQDYLARIRAATERMGTLIDDLLGLSRVSSSEFSRKTVDLSRISSSIAEELRSADVRRNVEVSVAEGLSADGDPGLLRVLMQNLLDNAWKFTRRQARARVEVGQRQQGGERVFYVRDNGVGFDMTYAAKLFGVFQRLHAVRDFEGSGVGLATAQRIVRRHGGRIWAEAEIGKGAVFYFTLG